MELAVKAALELAEEWGARFAQALEPLAGTSVRCEAIEAATPDWSRPMLVWRQEYLAPGGPAHYVAAPEEGWKALAGQVLAAAGLDEAGGEEAQSTYFELLSQAASGLAQTLSSRTGQEILCGSGGKVETVLHDGPWVSIRIGAPDPFGDPFLVSATAAIADLWQIRRGREEEDTPQVQAVSHYGTLDLLLDVELPVSVAFGRANLRIKDVLKLTTGSVIELDRAITEPVELVVNNCVVAKGEVVVVDGNYGVRIAQIMSREERLRSVA